METGQGQVSFSEEIIIINNANKPVSGPPINELKKGRPNKEQSAFNAENRKKQEQERKANNPPVRTSSRLAKQRFIEGEDVISSKVDITRQGWSMHIESAHPLNAYMHRL